MRIVLAPLVLLALSVSALSACGFSAEEKLHQYLKAIHPHGVPYEDAKRLVKATNAEAELFAALGNPVYETSRGNIVVLLGVLGTPNAIQKLRDTIPLGSVRCVLAKRWCAWTPSRHSAMRVRNWSSGAGGLSRGRSGCDEWVAKAHHLDAARRGFAGCAAAQSLYQCAWTVSTARRPDGLARASKPKCSAP
jgi:hypothetical protein